MESIETKLKTKMASIKLQQKIEDTTERRKSLNNPTKGKGSTILERLGTDLSQSGGLYDKCYSGKDCAGVLLGQLDRYLQNAVMSGQHELVYRNDNSLLILIDGTYFEISGIDLKNSVLKFARNAGVPMEFIGSSELSKSLIEGIIKLWQKHASGYDEINHLVK